MYCGAHESDETHKKINVTKRITNTNVIFIEDLTVIRVKIFLINSKKIMLNIVR